MHLFGVHSAFPGVDNDVVHLQVAQASRIKAQMQVHERAVQRYALTQHPDTVTMIQPNN